VKKAGNLLLVSKCTVRLLLVAQSTKLQLKFLRNKMLTRRVFWALNKDGLRIDCSRGFKKKKYNFLIMTKCTLD